MTRRPTCYSEHRRFCHLVSDRTRVTERTQSQFQRKNYQIFPNADTVFILAPRWIRLPVYLTSMLQLYFPKVQSNNEKHLSMHKAQGQKLNKYEPKSIINKQWSIFSNLLTSVKRVNDYFLISNIMKPFTITRCLLTKCIRATGWSENILHLRVNIDWHFYPWYIFFSIDVLNWITARLYQNSIAWFRWKLIKRHFLWEANGSTLQWNVPRMLHSHSRAMQN